MQSNRIVVALAADGISGLDISYGKNISTMYLNSHLYNEFVVRPAFLLGAAETMWVTFTKGELSTKPLLLAARQTTDDNNSRQVVDGTQSTIEKTPDTGYEYFMQMPDVVLQNVGEWSFSITITELPVDVEYKGQVNATSDLPSSGNAVGDTYWVGGSVNSYYYWNGSAWAVLNIVAVSTSDVGTITVNQSVGGQIGGIATDLDIQVLYNFVLRVINRLSDYLPKIVDGYWWVWNSDSKAYVNSGEVATSLITLRALTGLTKVPTINDTITSRTATFNRVPQIGETYVSLASTSNALGGDTYICLMKYTAENTSTYMYVGNTRGAQGEKGAKGADGEKGEKGDTGATGVGIASVTEEVVTGGTKVTITLTNGTSSSFVVYNGTAANITNLEFPHGDAVVTYDNTDGLHVHGNCRITLNGVTYDVPMDVEIPQTAGDGLSEDASDDAKGAVLKVDETVVRTNKTAQTINGDVTIGGNVTVKGTVTNVSSENLKVKNKLIVVADGNTVTLTSPAGLLAPKYDGTNNGALVFDGTGTAYVGDVVLDNNGDIDVTKSDLQPLVTRGTLADGKLVKWNADKLRLEDTGISADDVALKSDVGKAGNFIYTLNYESATVPSVGQVLTLTNANFSRTPIVGDEFVLMEVVDTKNAYFNNMQVLTVGDTTCTAKIMSFTDITSGKLDKVTSATSYQQCYTKWQNGTNAMINADRSALADALIIRDSGGRAKVANGSADDDIVNVGQMNAAIAAASIQVVTATYNGDDIFVTEAQRTILFGDQDVLLRWGDDSFTNYARRTYKSQTQVHFELLTSGGAYNVTAVVYSLSSTSLEITAQGVTPENVFNKTNTLSDSSTNTQYPSAKAVVDYVKANAGSEPYHITLTGNSGTITSEQYNGLANDDSSYILKGNYRLRKVYKDGADNLHYECINFTTEYIISIDTNYNWSYYAYPLQAVSQRVNTLSSSSTDTQYPSAKATYDADQSVLTEAKSYADSILGAEQAWLQKIDSGEGV